MFPAMCMNTNVNVRIKGHDGKLKQEITKHNKATRPLVMGIAKFLRGEFNTSNVQLNTVSAYDVGARPYIPAYISLGCGGVNTQSYKDQGFVIPATFTQDYYNNGYSPNFTSIQLRQELVKADCKRVKISRSSVGSYSAFDSADLIVSSYIPAGMYCNNFRDWFNPAANEDTIEYGVPMTITEIGLYSGDYGDSGAQLLASVLLDQDNVIVQDVDDVIIVTWTISIMSLQEDGTLYEGETETPNAQIGRYGQATWQVITE